MKHGMREAIKNAFEAPEPLRKQEFIQKTKQYQICCSEMGFGQFMWQQTAYIRKRAWALSFGIFLMELIGGCFMKRDVLWLLSAMMPFLAVSAVVENMRSETYGMTELEMATRFSLRSVVLARMGSLGLIHFVTLAFILVLGYGEGSRDVFRMGVYLLVPYLLADVSGLWLVRTIRGKEALYASLFIALVIGIFPVIARYTMALLYQEQYFAWWLIAMILLCVVFGMEWNKNLKMTEELEWSL